MVECVSMGGCVCVEGCVCMGGLCMYGRVYMYQGIMQQGLPHLAVGTGHVLSHVFPISSDRLPWFSYRLGLFIRISIHD